MRRLRSQRRRRANAACALAAMLLLPLAAGARDASEEPEAAAVAAREIERALELTPDTANGLRIYRICAECHQPEGWGVADGSYPQLAGQHRKVIIKQLADIRAGVRLNPKMCPYASSEKIGGAQAVADVAGYIDTLEISVATGKGPGEDLERGAALYSENCAPCHGDRGEGDGDKYIARLQSQHFAYLVRQFQAVLAGERGNADPEMAEHSQGISEAEARAILDYVSRIEPPEEFQAPAGWRNPDFPR